MGQDWGLVTLSGPKVVIENYVVVVLLYKLSEAVMLSQERFEFQRWAIKSELSWLNLLFFEHKFEERSAMASSLD